jgi:hypothetical protein
MKVFSRNENENEKQNMSTVSVLTGEPAAFDQHFSNYIFIFVQIQTKLLLNVSAKEPICNILPKIS